MDFIKDINLGDLPKKRYKVIKYALDFPHEVITMKTTDLANRLEVDPLTVFKACKEIGLDGFRDLKDRLKAQKLRSPMDKFLTEFAVNTGPEEGIRNSFAKDLEMLIGTIGRINPENIQKSAEAIIHSAQTYVIGLGYIGNVANYLQAIVRSHVPQIHSVTEYNGMLFDYMTHFKEGDVVLAIGFDKCQRQTIKAFKRAKVAGATTIALTDSEYSPLSGDADISLLVNSAPDYFLSPLIGAYSVCNALLHCIVEMTRPNSTQRSAEYNRLLAEENVYFNE